MTDPAEPVSPAAPVTALPAYDPSAKHKGAGKTARIPIKVVPADEVLRKPPWIRVRAATSTSRFTEIKQILREHRLHTVCEEASCPNIGECFGNGTATFMIMGDKCTRRCPFCDVGHGRPDPLDTEEPDNLARTIAALRLSYVVITTTFATVAPSISSTASGRCGCSRRPPGSRCWCPTFAADSTGRWPSSRQPRPMS